MPSFNGNTLVALGGGKTPVKIGMENDNKLPDSGKLKWKHPPTSSDLAQATGVDVKLIHGDRQEHISGSMGTVIEQDSNRQVQGKEFYSVTKKQTRVFGDDVAEMVMGAAEISIFKGRTLNVFQKEEYSVFGSREVTVTGLDAETYSSHREIDEPWKFETVPFDTAYKAVIVEICNLKTEACIGAHIDVQTLHIAAELLEETSKALTARLTALDNRILAVGSKIGAADLKLAARINGAPTESVTAPIAGA
jgi:hypothetical protein